MVNISRNVSQVSRLFLLLLILPVLGACRHGTEAKADQPAEVPVKLAAVTSGTLADSSDYIASLESRQSVTLQPRVQGQVAQILVKPGDEVAAGTPIIQIDPAQQRASVSSYVAAAESAQADTANAKETLRTYKAERLRRLADLKLSQTKYKRFSELYTSGAVSQDTLDQYRNTLEVAQASLGETEAKIRAQEAAIARSEKTLQQAQANTQQQQVQLQYFNITAPFNGKVGRIPVKVGDFVNTDTKLVTLTQNNQLEVNISIPSELASKVRIGTPVELLNTQGKKVGVSRVFFIAPNTSNDTQSVLVKSLFENSNGQLRADQQVTARIIWSNRPGVTVPATAISRVAGQNFVFVAENKDKGLVVRQQPVQLGSLQGNSYQVVDGLKAGERIAVTGLLKLSDGAKIVPES
jgi:multidrug efflux pump subunit AcrA (membrane-fusion protein)